MRPFTRGLWLLALTILATLSAHSQTLESANFVVTRNENNGRMNVLPCRVYVEDDQGLSVTTDKVSVFDLSRKVVTGRVQRKFVYLYGGETAMYILRSGKYTITAKTPLSEQDRYLESDSHEWISEIKTFIIAEPQTEHIFVVPNSDKASYTGGWFFSLNPEQD